MISTDNPLGQSEAGELSQAVEQLKKLEMELDDEHGMVKRELADWFREVDLELKRERARALNQKRRAAMVGRIAAREAQNQAAMAALWRRVACH